MLGYNTKVLVNGSIISFQRVLSQQTLSQQIHKSCHKLAKVQLLGQT